MAEPLRLEWLYPDALEANPLNWRKHPTGQAKAIEALLYGEDGVGWAGAALFNEVTGHLIDGHLRRDVAARRSEPIPVLVGSWTEEQERKILATLDPLAAMAEADREALGALLANVQSSDAAVMEMLSGLAEREGVLFGGNGQPPDDPGPQIDKASELQEKWQCRVGDLWVIPSLSVPGDEHRVACGDCTDKAVVERVMGGERAELCVTDPPYGVEYDPAWRGEDLNQTVHGEAIINDDNFNWLVAFSHVPADVLYVWLASNWLATVQMGIEKYGFQTKYLIIWNKDLAVFGRGNYHWKHEPCLYMVRKGQKTNWQGARDEKTVWDIPTIHSFKSGHNSEEWGLMGHSNQKPLECMERPIRNNSGFGAVVIDIFLGSGTTLVACERLGRLGRGIEIEPKYVSVALERLTGLGLTPRRLE